MAAQTGRSFVLKIGPAGSGTTLGAMRTTRMTINGEMIDVTTKDSANLMRELMPGGGMKSMTVQAEGILSAGTQIPTLVGYAIDGSLHDYSLIYDGGDAVDGEFQVTNFEAVGEYNGVQTYSITLESSGDLTFTPAA